MRFFRLSQSLCGLVLSTGMLLSSASMANDDLDVTMRMVTDDDALTDSVVREIRLDQPIGLEEGPGASSNPGAGNDTAREAREQGRAFGETAAERAKEAAQLRQDARDSGARGKPDVPAPDGPPGNPGRGPD